MSYEGPHPSDAILVARAKDDDRAAQAMLFRRHVRMVSGLIYRIRPTHTDLDDIVQDTFLAAFEGLARLENPQAFAAFVGSIAVRTTHKRLRRHRLAVKLGLAHKDDVDWEGIVAVDCPPDVALELRRIYAAIETFPTKERIALVLRRVEGMSLDEVAEATGESLATVKRRIAAAEARLAALRADG